jgi:hypothetical protein
LRFLGIVPRLEVSIYSIQCLHYKQFQTTFAQGGRGVNSLVEVTVNSKEENSKTFIQEFQEFGLWGAVIPPTKYSRINTENTGWRRRQKQSAGELERINLLFLVVFFFLLFLEV